MNRTGILIANGALFVLCCFLAARIIAAVAGDLLVPPPAEDPALTQRADPSGQGAKDPQVILRRNLFEVSTLGPTGPVEDEEVYAKTSLPVRLLGTAAFADLALSWAAVEDLETRDHLVVRVNDELKDRARVVRIDRRRIVLQNGPRREELALEEGSPLPPPTRSARDTRSRRPPRTARGNDIKSNVRQLGENRFAVPRADLESIVKNPTALFSQARYLPKYQDGEMIGIQLNSIEAGSMWEQIGIQDGDTITELNGIKVTGQQQSAQVLRELMEAKEFDVVITDPDGATRRIHGQPD